MARRKIGAKAQGARRGRLLLAVPLFAAACAPQSATPPEPLPLPAMDKQVPVQLDNVNYTIIRSALASAKAGYVLRVYRANSPAFDYSQGLEAKRVATGYCAGYNRALSPDSLGMFEAVGDWVFAGGCS